MALINKSIIWRAGVVLVIFSTAFYTAYRIYVPPPPPLPFYDPADVNPDLVDPEIQRVGMRHTIEPFSLLDQHGNMITEEITKNKVYMADFFFTTCPSICKDMARQKRWLQEEMASEVDFLILSHSVMPEVDTVEILAGYAELNGAVEGKWYLLTGERDSIYKLARKSYLVAKEPDQESDDHELIHTENFVLVDKRGRIRGFYDGTSQESVKKLAVDARRLMVSK